MSFIIADVAALRRQVASWRSAGERVAFVPTMGALHAGHAALVTRARQEADRVVVSIFVNPKQFAPHEDFNRYPRQLEQDAALLQSVGCDCLFAPTVETIYPAGFATSVDPGALATVLEGAVRPGHFVGVATVVTRLLQLVAPDSAFFGEKDYQQLLVIRQIVRDLALPFVIHGVATVRAEDGLALSSRNAYLSAAERAQALVLPQTLQRIAAAAPSAPDITALLEGGRSAIQQAGGALDYLVLGDAATLAPLAMLDRPARLLVAAKVGTTRLIDNVAVMPTHKQ